VLSQLLDEGYIIQKEGLRDRRQRLLELTPKGIELEQLLTERQRRRVARAFREAGPQAVEGFRTVLLNMIDDPDRARFVEDPKVRAAQRRGVP
jgi:DNA-binding MarR family transcriptional regulator